ncbi:MAG: disulfide bond formation protein B [Alphaproteobacteria bacterium]|nr:disulfide bond formation protein B [Alphaproteobacteria bacterium]
MWIIKLINYKNNLRFILLISLFCFISSLVSQVLFDKIPCLLCLFTRYGFLIVSIGCIFTLYYIDKKNVVFLPLISIIFVLIFSFYHLGVENHWWFAPEKCKTILPTLQELQSTTQLIKNTRPPCDTVNFKIFGISMTLFSFIVSSFIFWMHSLSITLYLYTNYNENKL